MPETTSPIALAQPAEGGPRKITREEDIPNIDGLKQQDKVVLTPEVKQEREVRRYIRKDGVFLKDLRSLWFKETGERDPNGHLKTGTDGLPRRAHTVTAEAADDFVKKVCEASGRKISKDSITGRPKATPGWNLAIRVPGMAQSEQNAAQISALDVRQKNTEALLAKAIDDNAALAEQVKLLLAKHATTETKPVEKMNHEELDAYAAAQDPPIEWPEDPVTKAEKLGIIRTAAQNTE